MSLNSVLQFLVPKDKKFFPLLLEHAGLLVEIAVALNQAMIVETVEERKVCFKEINDLEDKSDAITKKINFELSKNFLTPFDREDIYSLTKRMNSVADLIEDAVNRMELYHVEEVKGSFKHITKEIVHACQVIQEAIAALEGFKNPASVMKCCETLDNIEHEVDDIYDREISKIFDEYEDIKQIIKYKEVLTVLEETADRCKDVSNILERVSVKHS